MQCPRCGTALDGAVCPLCGLVLSAPPGQPPSAPAPATPATSHAQGESFASADSPATRQRPRWLLPTIVGVLAALVIGVLVMLLVVPAIFPAGAPQAPAASPAPSTALSSPSAVDTPTPTPTASPTASSSSLLVSQDFSSGSLPAGWTAVSGSWKVSGGRLVGSVGDSRGRIAFLNNAPANYRVDVLVRFVKVVDPSRWLNVALDYHAAADWGAVFVARSETTAANGLELAQRARASDDYLSDPTAAAPADIGVGSDHWLSIKVRGSSFEAYLDNTEVLSGDNLDRTGGGLGFVINRATVEFDDVTVTRIEG